MRRSGDRSLARFCPQQRPTFLTLLELDPEPVVLPADFTFRRIFQIVAAQVWVAAFNVWAIVDAPEWAGHRWAIDGKSIKLLSDLRRGAMPPWQR
jgi:hypothetical protein